MASKHDAKRARENFWVMQQNMAKQKGGRAGYQPKMAGFPRGTIKPVVAAVAEKPAPEATAEVVEASPSSNET